MASRLARALVALLALGSAPGRADDLAGGFDPGAGVGLLSTGAGDGTPIAARRGWVAEEIVPLDASSRLVLWASWPRRSWLAPELWSVASSPPQRLWPASGDRVTFKGPEFSLQPGRQGTRLEYLIGPGAPVGWWLSPLGADRVGPAAPTLLYASSSVPGLPLLPGGRDPGFDGLEGLAGPPTRAQALPVMHLRLASPAEIGPEVADAILRAAGYFDADILQVHLGRVRRRQKGASLSAYQAALMAFEQGHTYRAPRRAIELDDDLRRWLFEDWQQLRAALARYPVWPDIGRSSRRREYDAWVRAASRELKAVEAPARVGLMTSLMETETNQIHWRDFVPVVSYAGAVGLGQLLPATAAQVKVNPYDPAENVRGIAIHLNGLIRGARGLGLSGRAALRQALATYNGGDSFPRASLEYADEILARVDT